MNTSNTTHPPGSAPSRPSVADKRRRFRALHEHGCFAIPNPWDIGSALLLQSLGFKALATTSAGFAWAQGRADNRITLDMALQHLHEMVAATDLPMNADFENGFAADARGVGENVRLAVQTGVAGLSIEDSVNPGDGSTQSLFALDDAIARLRAARQAIDATGGDTLLVARCECFLTGQPDIDLAVTRLKAYANAGADCLYAPGVRTREHILALVQALAPKPLNVVISWPADFTMADLAAWGVRRVSVGGGLARAAWAGLVRAAQPLADQGSFAGFADITPSASINQLFHDRS